MEKILFLLKYFNKSSSYTVKRQFYTLILISVIATFLFSVQPVIMAYLINAIEEKEFSLSLSIITLAISYIAIMSMRKLSSALKIGRAHV